MSESVQRTMRHLRGQGCICAVVEKWNAFAGPVKPDGTRIGQRNDLFGIVDVLVLDPQRGFVGVQCCARTGYSNHFRKLTEDCSQACIDWLTTPGGKLEIWAWGKVKIVRGGKAERWEFKIRELTLDDFGIKQEEE
jgi:hypothetical protein